jgi:hypothetical protein
MNHKVPLVSVLGEKWTAGMELSAATASSQGAFALFSL